MKNLAAQLIQVLRKPWILFFIFWIIILGALALVFSLQPVQAPRNLTISNLSDTHATLSWVTQDLADQKVVIKTALKDFSVLPTKLLDRGTFYSGSGSVKLHTIELNSLKPTTTYYYRVYQNNKIVYQGRLKTPATLLSLSQPHPVYGRVLGPDRKTPLAGALVYLRVFVPSEASSSSTLLSTTTNTSGRWSIDLSALRKANLKDPFQLTSKVLEEVVIEAGKLGRVKATTTLDRDEPWPDIFLVAIKPKIASSSAQKKP